MKNKTIFLACLLALGQASYDLDEMAISACVGASIGHGKAGTVAAVRRSCSSRSDNCESTCRNADPFGGNGAARRWSCFDALHVYKNQPNPAPNDVGKVT